MASALVEEVLPVLRSLSSDSSSLLTSLQSALPADTDVLESAQGPSLLTLKNAALLNYVHHLVLLCSSRLRGHAMTAEGRQGGNATIVRNLIELRLVLEKIRPVEGRMRSLVERLMRAAEDEEKRGQEGEAGERKTLEGDEGAAEEVDPLSFRPNIAALSVAEKQEGEKASTPHGRSDGIYRPPRLAPVVYNPETAGVKKSSATKERIAPRNAALLSDLSASMSANPYETSSGGVGVGGGVDGSSSSARAKALARMQQYEEDNFTRLIMSKKDSKRRRRDEADVALGGAGMGSKRGRVGAGLEEEFGDLLRNSSELRSLKRGSALQRAKSTRSGGDDDGGDGFGGSAGGGRGRNAFQKAKRNNSSRRR